MATQSTVKKQKITSLPIIFTLPSLNPDVRIQVFHDWEFHVHSVVLKLHSALFRKFLDSADKVHDNAVEPSVSGSIVKQGSWGGAKPASGGCFRYEWVTQIDDDGNGWYLAEKSKALAEKQEMSHYKGRQIIEKNTFETMLKAIYSENEPHAGATLDELERLTAMADYYGALRVVSRAVDVGLLANSNLGPELKLGLIEATKLRNKALFQDSLILCLGPWSKPSFNDGGLEDHPNLFAVAKAAHATICVRLASVHHQMLNYASTEFNALHSTITEAKSIGDELVSAANRARMVAADDYVQLPLYYYFLSYSNTISSHVDKEEAYISPLLVNDMLLDKRANAGQKGFLDYFLIKHADGDEYEFPWDTKETVW
ncbi:hypothetical protein LSUB1_G004581 [Lachnellula subtilissima]|uniref:BTB domain-containing protein n=1 Tax=Lachnellula subtilissima TaxID=602034 RepID=A0A8H8UCT1_9HELO|nr:hypothetical protein LSUB1_G004581 [Lachnellula subtilissima]